MSGIHFPITGDNSSFLRSLQGCERGVSETARKIEQSGLGIEDMFGRLTRAAAAFGAGFTATEFVKKVALIRGEFQQLEVAFETMLGSEEKATALMSEVAKTAAITPFGLQDVAGGAKQLLAYGVAAEDTIDTLVRLGDIAAGLSIPLNDLVYLYGTTMTQGRMFTQDLRQFQGRGIPLADELAKQFGVTKDKVGELVTAGRVGFEEMRKAIISMTSEGGKFGGLMENQSKTITGQLSNIEDAIDGMFNAIGKSLEGVINDTLSVVSLLVENYEKVGEAVGVAVTAYGAYKAALMVGIAVQKAEAAITAEAALQKQLAAMAGHTLSTSQARATATSILFANAQRTVAASLKAVAAATIANPYVLAAAAITGLVYGVYKLATADTAAEAAAKRYNKAVEEQAKLENERKEALESYLGVLSDEYASSTAKVRAMNAIREAYPALIQKYIDEKGHITDLNALWKDYNEEVERNRVLQNKQNLEEAKQRLRGAEWSYKLADDLSDPSGRNKAKKNIAEAQADIVTYQKKVDDDNFVEWQKNLKKRTDQQITSELTELKRIQSARKNNKWYRMNTVSVGGYTGSVSDSELKKSIEALEAEQSLRNTVSSNYGKDYKKAYDEWTKAKKRLAEIEKDRAKFTTEQYEEAKKAEKNYRDAYEKLGGDVSGKQLKAQQNKIKKEQALNKEILDMRRDNQQAEIDLMAEGSEKKRRQIELDWQMEIDAIKQQKAEWENAQGGKLTDEQRDVLYTRARNATQSREKSISDLQFEDLNRDRKAWNEYLIQFGNYQQQKLALTEQYNEKWANAQSEGEKKLIEGQLGEELNALDEKFGYTTTLMADLFEDASNKSVGSIQAVIDKYEALVEYKTSGGEEVTKEQLITLGFSESDLASLENGKISIKDVMDAIKALKGELAGKSPFQAFANDVKEGFDKIKNAKGDTEKIGEGIGQIGSAVSSFAPALKQFSSNIGNIFGFDDSEVQGAIDAVDGLGQTAAGVGQIMSGDIVGGAMSAVQGISQVVTAFEGMFGADYSGYEKMKAEYEALISVWDEIIAKKQEYIDIDYGIEAQKAGEEVIRLTETEIARYKELGKARLNAGASAGSHSIGVRQSNRMGNEEWNQLMRAASKGGFSYSSIADGRMTGLFDLSAEQLEQLKEDAPAFWAKLDGDVVEYLNKIIQCGDAIEDTKDKMNEALVGVSFDGFYDGFVSTLLDMESSTEDFAQNLEKQLQTAILSGMSAEKFRSQLEQLYNDFSEAAKSDGKIIDTEADVLRARYQNIVDAAIAEREQLADAFGWDSSSTPTSSSSKGIANMSQETADELNGRFTALQIAGEETKNQMIAAVAALSNIQLSSTERNSLLKSILEQHVISNNFLEDLAAYSKVIAGFGEKLDNIVENTQNI